MGCTDDSPCNFSELNVLACNETKSSKKESRTYEPICGTNEENLDDDVKHTDADDADGGEQSSRNNDEQ